MSEKDLHYTIDELKTKLKGKKLPPLHPGELDVDLLKGILDLIQQTLLEKNKEYGSSFYNLRKDYEEYLPMRLTDKINRLRNLKQRKLDYTDTVIDIAGYAVLELYYLLLDS